jgi:hypothetical protein
MHVRHLPALSPGTRFTTALIVAIAAAAFVAVLYYLIGLGAIYVGTSSNGSSTDLGAFGSIVGTAFAVVALLLARLRSRLLWAVVGVLQIVVLLGYVVVGSVRTPAYEPWGLLIKACQVVILVAMGYLLLRSGHEPLSDR